MTESARPASASAAASVHPLPVLLLITLIWVPTLLRLTAEWSLNPQYYYGWAVPLLTAYLVYERLAFTPTPVPPARVGWVMVFIVLCALPQLPLRWLGEANSTSRLVSWAMSLCAGGITAALLYLSGGRPWVRHFAVLGFLYVAVPWPIFIEQPLVQGLMRINAQIAAEVVTFAGVPAEATGNVIHIPTGVLGVNEACSGIRSLQSTLMAAVFLGLLYQCGVRGCLLLVFSGAVIAFVCNVVRTVFLTWQGAFHGIEATEKWHDSAGFAILGVVLVCLWLISRFLERQETAGRETRAERREQG